MGFFKNGKGKRKFEYQPRYYKGEGSPYELKHTFDEFRTSVGEKKNLKGQFNVALNEFKASDNGGFNRTIIIAIVVLVFMFLFLIDFDLSIFLP